MRLIQKTKTSQARTHLRRMMTVLLLTVLLLSSAPAHAQDATPAPPVPAQANNTGPTYFPLVASVSRPRSPWPSNEAEHVSVNTWLAWVFTNAAFPDPRYTIYLEASDPTPDVVVAQNLNQLYFDPPRLELASTYYWQIVAFSSNGKSVASGLYEFRTFDPANAPPPGSMITIPAGEFMMGCDTDVTGGYGCRKREIPLHPVLLDGYEIDRYEATNREYRECMWAGVCNPPRLSGSLMRDSYYYEPAFDNYPVLYVSWWDAEEYCGHVGKRLPTEAEWEKAARGTIDTRPWPWGFEDITCDVANFTDTRKGPWLVCRGDTSAITDYPTGASPYGVFDMAGNSFEWVWDKWREDYYWTSPPYYNPTGPGGSRDPDDRPSFVIRGGSYRPDWYYPRTFNRHWGHHGDNSSDTDAPFYRNNQGGFRCAR